MQIKSVAVMAGLLGGSLLGLSTLPAQASYIVYVYQQGANVEVSGSGSIDLTGLGFGGKAAAVSGVSGVYGQIIAGGQSGSNEVVYTGLGSLTSFGSSLPVAADASTGSQVGVEGDTGRLFLPADYKSGTSLGLSTLRFNNTTISALGLTTGTYTFTAPNDVVTVNIGPSPVPLPAAAPLFGAALIGLGAAGFRLKRKAAAAG